MNLPKKIKFGHQFIEIEYDETLWYRRQVSGDCHIDDAWIVIDSTFGCEAQRHILFLQTLWIAFRSLSIMNENHDGLESVIMGLFAVVRDNRDLIKPQLATKLEMIRILGVNIRIEKSDVMDFNGIYDSKIPVMKIATRLREEQVYRTLLHEIIHVVQKELSLPKVSEKDVENMDWVMSMLFTQNDFSWVLEDGDEST